MNRRHLLVAAPAALVAGPALARTGPITVYKTPTCGCCDGWVRHLSANGFTPTVVVREDLTPLARQRGIPPSLMSCHMGETGGYTVVGHVPAADVKRLLEQKPRAIGLTVPGMPLGSPGMEAPNGESERYETLLIQRGGTTRVFATHAARPGRG